MYEGFSPLYTGANSNLTYQRSDAGSTRLFKICVFKLSNIVKYFFNFYNLETTLVFIEYLFYPFFK